MSLKLPERKIIRMTKYSYMITLPKLWINLLNLDNESKVEFEITNDRNLIIKPKDQNNK